MGSSEFAIAEVMTGKLNALVKNLMRQMNITDPNEAVRRINSGEWIVSQRVGRWHERDGIIYFSVTSDGAGSEAWIKRLEDKGFRIGDYAKSLLCSSDFKPTSNVTHEIAVLKGVLFEDDDRITKKICAEADKRKLAKPNAEVACLIREKFTDKELEAMGLWWVITMHEPIKDSDGGPGFLGVGRSGDGRWLDADYDDPDDGWSRDSGFAFAVAQVDS